MTTATEKEKPPIKEAIFKSVITKQVEKECALHRKIKVTDDESCRQAERALKFVAGVRKSIESVAEPLVQANYQHYKRSRAYVDEKLAPYEDLEETLRRAIKEFRTADDKRRKALGQQLSAAVAALPATPASQQFIDVGPGGEELVAADDAPVFFEEVAAAVTVAPAETEVPMFDYWFATPPQTVEERNKALQAIIDGVIPADVIEWKQGRINEYADQLRGLMLWPGFTADYETRPIARLR